MHTSFCITLHDLIEVKTINNQPQLKDEVLRFMFHDAFPQLESFVRTHLVTWNTVRVCGKKVATNVCCTLLINVPYLLLRPFTRSYETIKIGTIRERNQLRRTTRIKLLTFLFECCQCFSDTAHRRFQLGEQDIMDEFQAFDEFTIIYKACNTHCQRSACGVITFDPYCRFYSGHP